jgi:ATP-dependent DNA helicase RecQ
MAVLTPPHQPPAVSPRALTPARRKLAEVFGYHEFRAGQAEVIAAVLGRRDTLAVMPTGGGKSICYQLPALLFDEGLTVVVSPLLALMKDQVDALRQAGVPAAAINSTIPREEQGAILGQAAVGAIRLLYVAPERFGDGQFMAGLRRAKVALLAIDEAHCISQWGHDFRPSYRELGDVRPRLGSPPIVALTATADPLVRDDIVARLRLDDPVVLVAGFDRPNLRFDVVRLRYIKDKADQIVARLKELGNEDSAIVYCGTRKRVEELTDILQRERVRCARYHAGMEDADRKRIQDAFARDSLRIIVATNAFGMGIDKPDVRMVLHHDMPESLESYYQEAGRAGRDGGSAECVLYYTPRDRELREFFINLSHPPAETVLRVYRSLAGNEGRRTHIKDLMVSEDEPGVNAAVQALVDCGLAGKQGYMAWATRPGGEEEIDTAGLEAHREHALSKLDAMERYAQSFSCLRRRILDYFGEEGHGVACGNCGPCQASRTQTATDRAADENDRLFHALRAVRRKFAEEANLPPFTIFSDATLHEMARRKPRNRAEMLSITGVGIAKWEKFGEAFLAVTRPAAPPLPSALAKSVPAAPRVPVHRAADGSRVPSTSKRTWELWREGLDIPEMAERRGLSTSTITAHLADLILAGEVDDISRWVDDVTLARIRKAAGDGPIGALAPLREAVGDGVTYDQLHLARAWLNRRATAR